MPSTKITVRGALAVALLTAGCGSATSGGASSSGATNTCPAGASTSIKIGFSMYNFATPYGRGVTQGAKDEGRDLCVNLVANGTPAFDLTAVTQILESESAAGAQGLTAPGSDQTAKTLSDQLAHGKSVSQFSECSPLLQSLCISSARRQEGRVVGQKLLDLIGGNSATGTALVGACLPGLQFVTLREAGLREVLSQASGLKVLPLIATDSDESKNLPIWEQAVAAHPEAKILISLCSTDSQSIGRVNSEHNNQLTAVGTDITPESMAALKAGSLKFVLGGRDYVQGYMATRVVVDSVLAKKPLAVGWLDTGTELATKDNVDTYLGFFSGSGQSAHDFYSQLIHEDYAGMIQPLAKQTS